MGAGRPKGTTGRALVVRRRLLNELPGTRATATALDAFLNVAGWQLYQAYRAQFVKLLHYIDREFLPQLTHVSLEADEFARILALMPEGREPSGGAA